MTRRVTGDSKAGRQLRSRHSVPRLDNYRPQERSEIDEWNRQVEKKKAAREARRREEREG